MKTQTLSYKELKGLLTDKALLPFNRDIQVRHVQKMAKSIEECGLLRLPVLGRLLYEDNQPLAIIDGQHLINALVNNKKGNIQCIVKDYDHKRDVIDDISKLNNTQKTWNDVNYLDAWFKYGKDNLDSWSNYSYLYTQYQNNNLPCGYLVELYSSSKKDFRTGSLTFWNREYSDKVFQIANMLKNKYRKPAHTLQGLTNWAKKMYTDKKSVDFNKLNSRLSVALRNDEDRNCNGRDDFKDFLNDLYTRA